MLGFGTAERIFAGIPRSSPSKRRGAVLPESEGSTYSHQENRCSNYREDGDALRFMGHHRPVGLVA